MEGGRDPFSHFGDPFGSFGSFNGLNRSRGPFGSFGGFNGFSGFGRPLGNFGGFSGFSGFGDHSRLISSFMGGHDPFSDPFFSSPFDPSFIRSVESPFVNPNISGHISHEPPSVIRSRGPIIEELNSDDEESGKVEENDVNANPRKHRRSKEEPLVEDPDEITGNNRKRNPRPTYANQFQHLPSQPHSQSFTFHSSSVSYGGANGAYYTSSKTRRTGSDGMMFEECKEANSSSGQATHRVTRGIHDKGHSVTRKLSSGSHQVDTRQTLYNLEKDELADFNEAWNGNVQRHLPHLSNDQGQQQPYNNTPLALPSTEISGNAGTARPGPHSRSMITKHGTSKARSSFQRQF